MPYAEHPAFGKIQPAQRIWRYKGFSDFLWMLHTNKLHFHRVGDFPDDFEGTIPKSIHQIRKQDIQQAIEEEQEDIDSEIIENIINSEPAGRQITYANCWHAKNSESVAMWESYREQGQPIVIKSTVSKLINAVDIIDDDVHIGKISYVDYYSDWGNLSETDKKRINRVYSTTESSNAFHPILLKRREFEHEHEIRAVTTDFESLSESIEMRNYKNYKIYMGDLIEEIRIHPDASDRFIETVETAVDNSGLPIDSDYVKSSAMAQGPWPEWSQNST